MLKFTKLDSGSFTKLQCTVQNKRDGKFNGQGL